MRRRDVLRLAPSVLPLWGGLPARGSTGFEPLGAVDLPAALEAVVGPDDTAYVATGTGFAVIDVADPSSPTPLAVRSSILADHDRGPLGGIQDVAVDGDRLLVVGPADVTEAEVLSAAVVYDVSDPAAPERLAVHETDFSIHNGSLDDGYAFLTGNDRVDEPLVIVDESGIEVGRWSIPGYDGRWRSVNPWLRNLHDITVHDGRAYCSFWEAGTWIIDVSDPRSPAFISRLGGRSRSTLAAETDVGRALSELPGNHHSTAVNGRGTLVAVGKEAWSPDPERAPGGIDLWSVVDPEHPLPLSHIEPPPTEDPSHDGVWTTAHNFDLRDARLYAAWYQGGVTVHDVGSPQNPVEIAGWRDHTQARFWTAQRASDHIVASDMGIREGEAELVTFPDPARPKETTGQPSTSGRPVTEPSPTPNRSPPMEDGPGTPGRSAGRVGTSAGEAAVGIGILAALGIAARRWR